MASKLSQLEITGGVEHLACPKCHSTMMGGWWIRKQLEVGGVRTFDSFARCTACLPFDLASQPCDLPGFHLRCHGCPNCFHSASETAPPALQLRLIRAYQISDEQHKYKPFPEISGWFCCASCYKRYCDNLVVNKQTLYRCQCKCCDTIVRLQARIYRGPSMLPSIPEEVDELKEATLLRLYQEGMPPS